MKHTKLALLFLDALCVGMFSLGGAWVVLPALGLPNAPGLCAAAVLLGIGVCALWEHKPWLIPTIAAGCGLLALLIFALLGQLPGAALVVSWYVRWAVEISLGGNLQFPVCFAMVLPITVLFWLVMRKLPSLWLVTLLAVGLASYQVVFLPEGWLPPFFLLSAGLILFLPRASISGEGRLQAQLLAAVLAVPVLGLTLLCGPKSNGAWRSVAVGHLVQDAQDFWEYHWGELPALPITSMRGMGLQPQKNHLGGDIEPSDTPVITGSQKLLLRGQALDVYTGTGWEDSSTQENGNFRLESVFWQGRRKEAFGLNQPPPVSIPLLNELLIEVDAELRPLRNFRSLFVPYRTQTIELGHDSGNELFFNRQGEVYWQSQPQTSPEYHVKGRAWNFRDKDFDRNMLLLEKALAGRGIDPAYAQVEEVCLQLPDTLPDWVEELAGTLTADCPSPYAKAAALRDYLSEACQYTLTPGPPSQSQDFVAEFLTKRKGYCTYYASALTVLCRCVGVPARYATGYGMRANGKRYEAAQATAHAWTEIYLAHAGWVPLDALTQDIFAQNDPVPENSQAGGDAMGSATPQPTPGVPGELPAPEPESQPFHPLFLLWAVPVLAAAGALLMGKALRSRRYTYQYVRRKFSETGQAAEHCYAGLLGLLRIGKLSPQSGETLLMFWERAAEQLPQKTGIDWRKPGVVMDRLRFGNAVPTEEEIAALCETYQALREHVRKAKGPLGRLWI